MSSKRRRILRLGLPKGSLQETTARLFELAGYNIRFPSRSYYPEIDDSEIECILIRAQEMARYVEQGVLDAGITGVDWVQENGAKVKELADLKAPWPNYRTVRWLLAVKAGSKFRSVKDLQGKRIATEAVGLTRRYLKKHGVKAEIEFSYGATEVKPPILADAIVDVSETGSSIRANNLRVLDTVLETTPRFIANKESVKDAWKKRKLDRLLLMLRGAITAAGRVGLKLNAQRKDLDAVLAVLPALGTPTISALANDEWVALEIIVEETVVRDLLPELVELGAEGIVEYPINKIIH
ncbi:MAG: ATP phosphoribosyltransferase [Deltaproteobacteria bacterium]|nr:ATP phosphoribosyltransferase [Deltaproteobacteria bacterium]MBW2397014.1 ATP phosphoribosyltransferase [Deltaproteobacteria bacterium]